jgi:hypothetical protein
MADVFLSYKREDRARAKEIADAIEKHGYSVFFDAEIGVGESWNTRIEREVNAAKCVVVLWSERSSNSATGEWVHNEARLGKSRAILAPAFIGDCEAPLEFSSVQAADLRNWRGDVSEAEWVRFVSRVGELVQREPKKLRAQPWRRRWVRIAAALVLVGVIAGTVAYYRPWEQGARASGNGVGGGVTTAAAPERAWEALGQLLALGDCDGLDQEVQRLGATYSEIADVGPIKVRECRRMLAGVALAPTAGTEAPATNDGASASPAPTAPLVTNADEPSFFATLARGDRSAATLADIRRIAAEFELETPVLGAVVDVESNPQGAFAPDGRPVILFEPHLFSRRTNRQYDASHPNVSYANWGARPYPRTQEDRWAQLAEAYELDREAALASTSWGRFQILGLNYAAAGFDSPSAMVAFLAQSDANNIVVAARFIRSNNLVDELQRRDWEGFARNYNGAGQAARYGRQLAEAYTRLSTAESAN